MTDTEREARRQEQIRRNQGLIELLEEWSYADPEEEVEQRATWELLKRYLDEDRTSYRKLFR